MLGGAFLNVATTCMRDTKAPPCGPHLCNDTIFIDFYIQGAGANGRGEGPKLSLSIFMAYANISDYQNSLFLR